MFNDPFRIEPGMPVGSYKSYTIAQPLDTHFRAATCAEVGCPDYLNGWQVRVEHLDEQLLHTAKTSGRRFRELAIAQGETYLVYEAGQSCFQVSRHRLPLERPELYVVRDGDWRGNPTGVVRQATAQSWTDDFGEHQEQLADRMKQG
jgi:hypothetical protein